MSGSGFVDGSGRSWLVLELDACPDCVVAAANGEFPDRDAELVELERVRAARPGDYAGRGPFVREPDALALLGAEDRLSTVAPADEDSGTESFFSWSPCGACGSRLGGDRYACELVTPALVEGVAL